MREADNKQAPKNSPETHEAKQTELKGEMEDSTLTVGDFNIPLSGTDGRQDRESQGAEDLKSTTITLTPVTSTEHPHTHPFQVHTEHSPGYTICQAIKQVSINLKGLKPHKAHSPTTTELEIRSRRKLGKFTNIWTLNNFK